LRRGLSNIEKKRVGELDIVGLFLKGVKTSRVHTTQGSSYVKIIGFVSWLHITDLYQE